MPRHLPRKWNFRKVFVSAARSYGSTVVRRFPAFSSSTLVNSPTLLLRIILNLLAEGRYYLLNRRKSISFFFFAQFQKEVHLFVSLYLFRLAFNTMISRLHFLSPTGGRRNRRSTRSKREREKKDKEKSYTSQDAKW